MCDLIGICADTGGRLGGVAGGYSTVTAVHVTAETQPLCPLWNVVATQIANIKI